MGIAHKKQIDQEFSEVERAHLHGVDLGSAAERRGSSRKNKKGKVIQWMLVALDFLSILLPALYFANSVSLIYPIMIAVVQPFVFREQKLYWRHGQVYKKGWLQIGQIIRSYLFIFLIFSVFTFVTEALGARPNPANLSVLFIAIIFLNLTLRLMLACGLYSLRRGKPTRFVIIGNTERAFFLANEIKQYPKKMHFLGYVVEKKELDTCSEYGDEVIGFIDDLDSLVYQLGIKGIVVVMDHVELDDLLWTTDQVAHLPVQGYIFNDHFDVIRQRYWSVSLGSVRVSAIDRQIDSHSFEMVKRLFDVAISASVLLVASPLFLVLAIAVKISSRGPVFFVSERVRNRGGEKFNLLKFRSMYVRDANFEEERKAGIERGFSGKVIDTENTKVVPKGAITPLGYFLRKSSLDELPQLINVLRGDMSLVGPRPTTMYEFNRYKDWHKRRLDSKPGITGLWQVVARSKTTFDDQVKLDMYYIDHQSIWFDIEILIKTAPVMLFGKGGG